MKAGIGARDSVEVDRERVIIRSGNVTVSVYFGNTENVVVANRDEGGPTEKITRERGVG